MMRKNAIVSGDMSTLPVTDINWKTNSPGNPDNKVWKSAKQINQELDDAFAPKVIKTYREKGAVVKVYEAR